MSSKGRRYEEPKLNIKKVVAVIIALVVFIMCIFIIGGILAKDEDKRKDNKREFFCSI